MNKGLKRIITGCLAVSLFFGIGRFDAYASNSREDGEYTGKILLLKETKDQESMCSELLDHDVDVKISENEAEVRIYAVFPVEGFGKADDEGTLKDMVLTIDGEQYTAVSDIKEKPKREMDKKSTMFRIKVGDVKPTQVLTFKFPAEKLDSVNKAPVKAYVYALGSEKDFRLTLSDLQRKGGAAPEGTSPTAVTEKNVQITAMIGAPAANYEVTIPSTVTMGTLSAERDNVLPYTVNVSAENMGNGYVTISAPASGTLTNNGHTLEFTNDMGTKKAKNTTTLNGNFKVKADAVKSAVAGNYTGTANFTISYFSANA